jgi:hypothetical protein
MPFYRMLRRGQIAMSLAKTMKIQGLTGGALKIIAIAAMTVDHLAWAIYPGTAVAPVPVAMHVVGRLTAPIMMYMIAEGYFHTANVRKYIRRLLLFAVISHFAYAYLFGLDFIPLRASVFNQTSVMWPFAMGLAALAVSRSENPKFKPWHKQALVCLCLIAAFPGDWSTPAALCILYMGNSHGNFKKQMAYLLLWIACYALVYAIFLDAFYGIMQMSVVLAVPLLRLYNGRRGRLGMKWFFYAYYPLHMILIAIVFGRTFVF